MRRRVVACAVLPIIAFGARAQDSASVDAQVRTFVKGYADAANSGDVSAYAGMYRDSPDLITINDGEIKRGWSSIRDEANQLLGVVGQYRIAAGVVDVLRLGPRAAIATFPYVMTVQFQQGPVQRNGAATLVLEKVGSHWLIVADHWSTQRPATSGGK